MRNSRKSLRGSTLLELVVAGGVLVILSVIATSYTMELLRVGNKIERAKDSDFSAQLIMERMMHASERAGDIKESQSRFNEANGMLTLVDNKSAVTQFFAKDAALWQSDNGVVSRLTPNTVILEEFLLIPVSEGRGETTSVRVRVVMRDVITSERVEFNNPREYVYAVGLE